MEENIITVWKLGSHDPGFRCVWNFKSTGIRCICCWGIIINNLITACNHFKGRVAFNWWSKVVRPARSGNVDFFNDVPKTRHLRWWPTSDIEWATQTQIEGRANYLLSLYQSWVQGSPWGSYPNEMNNCRCRASSKPLREWPIAAILQLATLWRVNNLLTIVEIKNTKINQPDWIVARFYRFC